MPTQWRAVGTEVAKTKTSFEATAASIGVVAGGMALSTRSPRRRRDTGTTSAASVAKNIGAGTDSFMKWTGIVSLVTGSAGLFGFARLAHSVSGTRMPAMGTGAGHIAQLFAIDCRRGRQSGRLRDEPSARQLEHHALSRRAAIGRRALEIAGSVGNQAGPGRSPVAAPREGIEHRLGPARRELRVLPVVVTELKFRDIERHIFPAHFVEPTDHAALEDRLESFDGLSVDSTDNLLAFGVINDAMDIRRQDACIRPIDRCKAS